MFRALTLFFILAGQGILGPLGVDAASLVPTDAVRVLSNPHQAAKLTRTVRNFNRETQAPPDSSGGHIVFNWHASNDSGDHNAVDTRIFMLTDGGNSTLADNSTSGYVIEAVAVQFNKTHFSQAASSTPWVAIFPCTANSPAGNSSELIDNAQRLGAHAILAYTEGTTYQYCNLTENTPPATIPIYATENWHDAFLVFSDEMDSLFAPTPLKFYNATAMSALAASNGTVTHDFASLRTNSSFLTQSNAVLTRIPAIASNVSAAELAFAASASAGGGAGGAGAGGKGTTASGAGRVRVGVGHRRRKKRSEVSTMPSGGLEPPTLSFPKYRVGVFLRSIYSRTFQISAELRPAGKKGTIQNSTHVLGWARTTVLVAAAVEQSLGASCILHEDFFALLRGEYPGSDRHKHKNCSSLNPRRQPSLDSRRFPLLSLPLLAMFVWLASPSVLPGPSIPCLNAWSLNAWCCPSVLDGDNQDFHIRILAVPAAR
ncbi:hypothetical protein DFH06DRAFT_1405909 [Mycena polygramma]|nr:hypothetical protein DFH06DRAFT_1405909 [Mycena polygramma]